MAARHPGSPAAMQLHQGPSGPPPPGHAPPQQWTSAQQLVAMNEAVWLQLGSFAEVLGDPDEASTAYQHALRANPRSIPAMNGISTILRSANQWQKATEYLQSILKLDMNNGEVWGSLGHCFLMMEDLQQAYSAYQQALYHMPDPKEPKLWYGIGILYDRYGSLEHAEEAFSQVMRMAPDFDKANEIYFRLGIIYKQQKKYQQSLECFRYICTIPPSPLTEEDIWFQIGHVYEQNADFENAKLAYRRVLDRDPNHAKVLQQLGWLHHQDNSRESQDTAIEFLEKSVSSDQNDAQSWYLLGRCYMSQLKFPKAYEAYQQAVYRDGRNPTFWCSIGVLYYQINQYRDALDAYSRAIRLNPYISEVWYDLGTLYESCNNQVNDALDAYQRAAELDPNNAHIKARLQLLRSGQSGAPGQASAPLPQDVHPQAYQASGAVGPPGPQWGNPAPPAPQGPPSGPSMNGWGGRLAELNPPPQPPNPYDREPARPPIQAPPGAPSPRLDHQGRPYPGPGSDRPPPPPPPARRSPPREHHAQMGPYPGPGLSQPPLPPTQVPPPQQPRAPNASYPAAGPSAALPAPPALNGTGPVALPPFGRVASPRPEVRPIMENRPSSPKPSYPRMPYQHHPDAANPGGIEGGAPPPPSALAAEAAAVERNGDRPGSAGPKRHREWEEDTSMKKPASEEARAQMENRHHRRPSSPLGDPSRRSSSEIRRAEEQRHIEDQRRVDDQRRANENYHPSEAAHHPPTHGAPNHLPPMQQGPPAHSPVHEHPPPPPPPAPKEYPSEERERERERLDHPPPPPPPVGEPERAARKMEVDEDYDDEGDDEKKASTSGSGPGSASGEVKSGSPAGVNGRVANGVGMSNGQTKVEQPA